MKKPFSLALICTLVAGFSLLLVLRAQENGIVFKTAVHLVEVYATVFDHKGNYVDELRRDQFEVYEDGKPQKIAGFETQAGALSCAILLDTSGSMARVLPLVKNSVVKLIDGLDPHDSVAVYAFNEQLVVRQEFTTDKGMAKRSVLRTRAEGGTALFDALSEVSLEAASRHGKKAIILFTDGDDNLSILTVDSAVTRAKKLGIPLFAIAAGEATSSQNLKRILDKLSQRTGGASYEVKKPKDIDGVFLQITEDLKHIYMISYQASSADSDGKWRKIDLVVKGVGKFWVRAREGYYPD
jgi:Ca-activated chloride channel homolog